MATKREVMIAGIPAKLSHMLASDTPMTIQVPGVTDQNSAAALETNFVALTGTIGAVRLPPATGQYLHVLLNVSNGDQLVYPDGTETINNLFPGQPAILPGGQLMIAVPSRRQWAAGTLNGLAGAEEPMEIPGPLVVGVPVPSPLPAEGAVTASQLDIRPGGMPGNVSASALFFNLYNDDNGALHYLDNGPAAVLVNNIGTVGTSGAQIAQLSLVAEAPNSAGPGAPAALQPGLFHVVYGVPGQPSNPVALVGPTGNLPYPLPLPNTLIADQYASRGEPSPSLAGDVQAVLGLNSYMAADGSMHYVANGPAGFVMVRQSDPATGVTMARITIAAYDINNAGAGAVPTGGGGLQIVYGSPGAAPNPFVIVGAGTQILPIFGTNPAMPYSLIANQMVVQAEIASAGGQNAARLGLNMYLDNTSTYHYLQNGPGVVVAARDQYPLGTPNMGHLYLAAYAVGTAGGSVSGATANACYVWSGTLAANQTSIGVDYSPDGATHVAAGRVMVGGTGTGPGGVGRALYLV